ncbi:hypothetical protein NP233_g2730 [Leucocoprinus birnbaumii]|uniref:Uncharacterized protein n=1 Tax=Leucocoprinus birnbaumii TaxID=56174 RepID=A0AAD5VYD0_9AGAR|nr:hypothetical protein NP233_g2730 [Leucocoprinus birnbaumii]
MLAKPQLFLSPVAMGEIGPCVPTPRYTVRFVKTCWLVGSILAGICYGFLVMLSYNCLTALRRRADRSSLTRSRLSIYVLVTVLAASVSEAMDIKVTIDGVLDQTCQGDHVQPLNPYLGRVDIAFLIINLLTDGLLVWRCWAIARGFSGKKWMAAWVVPLIVYIVMVVTGIILIVIFSISPKRGGIGDKLIVVQFGISLLLNSLISSSIVSLILYHRRMMAAYDPGLAQPYLGVVTILVESALLTVFVDVFAIITIPLIPVGGIAFQMWVQVQPIASLLIIYRVSLGTDYFNGRESIPETLVFTSVPPISHIETAGEIESHSAHLSSMIKTK